MIMIGSDPELAFAKVKNKTSLHFFSASSLINDPDNRKKFGLDGCSFTAELRPSPFEEPLSHAEELERILYSTKKSHPQWFDNGLFGFSYDHPIGGHIHFGNENLIPHASINKQSDLVNYLNSFLAFPYMFLENPDFARERKSRYGQLGDMRSQSYGIEYRTLSSWLASKKLAQGVLSLAYVVAYEAIESDKFDNKKCISKIKPFPDLYQNHQIGILRPWLNVAMNSVRDMTLYEKYKDQIEFLFYHAKKQDHITMGDVRKGWKIPYVEVKASIMFTLLQLVKMFTQNMTDPQGELSNFFSFVGSERIHDFEIERICQRINYAMNIILTGKLESDSSVNSLRIYGVNKSEGNKITITYNDNVYSLEQIDRMTRLMKDICLAMGYENEVKFEYIPKGLGRTISSGGKSYMMVGLSRSIREEQTYLAECLSFIALLYSNNSIYKSYRKSKKTGNDVDLEILATSLVNTIKRGTDQKVKSLSPIVEDGADLSRDEIRVATNYLQILPS